MTHDPLSNRNMQTDPAQSDTCPKQDWILGCLTDDECPIEERTWSHAVRFHLKRCQSCRELAGRVQAVTGLLEKMGSQSSDEDLLVVANERVMATLGIDDPAMQARVQARVLGAERLSGNGQSRDSLRSMGGARGGANTLWKKFVGNSWGGYAVAAMVGFAVLLTVRIVSLQQRADDSVPVTHSNAPWPFADVFPDVPDHIRRSLSEPSGNTADDALLADRSDRRPDARTSDTRRREFDSFLVPIPTIRRDVRIDEDAKPDYGPVQPAYTFSPYFGSPAPADRQ